MTIFLARVLATSVTIFFLSTLQAEVTPSRAADIALNPCNHVDDYKRHNCYLANAILEGDHSFMRTLLTTSPMKNYIRINERAVIECNQSPFLVCALGTVGMRRTDVEAAKILFEFGADPNVKLTSGLPVVFKLLDVRNPRYLEVLTTLTDRGLDPNSRQFAITGNMERPLLWIVADDCNNSSTTGALELLLSKGADPNFVVHGANYVHWKVAKTTRNPPAPCTLVVVEKLLSVSPSLLTAVDESGWLPINYSGNLPQGRLSRASVRFKCIFVNDKYRNTRPLHDLLLRLGSPPAKTFREWQVSPCSMGLVYREFGIGRN